MPSNVIDDVLASAQATLARAGITFTPLTILITVLVAFSPLILVGIFALTQADQPLPPPPGCRKLGRSGTSNLEDQYSKKYAKGGEPTPEKPWSVKALFVYPVKSCGPVEVDESDIVHSGLKYDRQFTLAHYVTSMPSLEGKVTSEWHFITQRKYPRLALVETDVWVPDPSAPGYAPDSEWVQSEGCVEIRFPFTPDSDFTLQGLKNYGKILAAKLRGHAEPTLSFRVPFNPPPSRLETYKTETLHIWKDTPLALNMGVEIPAPLLAKLQYTLGTTNPMTLFRADPAQLRKVFKNAPQATSIGHQPVIAMADSYPVHLLNLASVHDVASKLPRGDTPTTMWKVPLLNALRFRANMYITGPPAFAEDDWATARVGDTEYHVSCRTTRCKLPNVDPETGMADCNEPGTTLRGYRVIDAGSKSACLGMQITPLKEGKVKVGDAVEMLEKGEHFFVGGEGRNVHG